MSIARNGHLEGIFYSPAAGEAMVSLAQANLEAGRGLVGDRYYLQTGTFSERLKGLPDVELTLIEAEEVEAFNRVAGQDLRPEAFRRNLVTRGVRLNDLVGKVFTVGAVKLKGVRLCEPCAHLSGLLGPAIMERMVHKSGLRAQVLANGAVVEGDRLD